VCVRDIFKGQLLMPVVGLSVLWNTVFARLRSADHGDIVISRSCTVRFGQRSFHSSALSVWNDLPSELKNSDISRQGFKSSLKSWLFERAYS